MLKLNNKVSTVNGRQIFTEVYMSKPKHPMPNKTSKKVSKEVRGGLLAGDTPKPQQTKPNLQVKRNAPKKGVHRNEKRVSTRTPHADDGTWERIGESKILEKARSFAKTLIKNSMNKMNKFFKGKSPKK